MLPNIQLVCAGTDIWTPDFPTASFVCLTTFLSFCSLLLVFPKMLMNQTLSFLGQVNLWVIWKMRLLFPRLNIQIPSTNPESGYDLRQWTWSHLEAFPQQSHSSLNTPLTSWLLEVWCIRGRQTDQKQTNKQTKKKQRERQRQRERDREREDILQQEAYFDFHPQVIRASK